MLLAAALEGLAVVDTLVRFFAFDLPFELPFLTTVLTVGRLTVLALGGALEVVEVASVLLVPVAVARPVVVPGGAAVVRDTGDSAAVDRTTVGNIVVVSAPRVTTASGSAMFVRPGVGGVASSSRSSLSPSSGVEVTNG